MEIMWKIKEICTCLIGKPPHYSEQLERHDDQSESSQSSDEKVRCRTNTPLVCRHNTK